MDICGEGKRYGPRYLKLAEFCRRALENDCPLACSDTCCIDKSSSSELNEAIRSMYRSYHNPYICLVHLGNSMTVADFGVEEWFTRGWTIQELLAPHKPKFHIKEWDPVSRSSDDKQNHFLLDGISSVTHIPIADLETFSPGTSRVREKMAWASRRKTTRREDVAYALMGIFDVSMTIAYGEGERAFHQLMVAIFQKPRNGTCSHGLVHRRVI